MIPTLGRVPDAPARRTGDDRIVTIPNVITVIRLLCVPVFLWLLFGRDDRAGAAWLLAAMGTTDWVDGYIARHFAQGSTLGKIIDPIADRVLLGVGVGAIVADRSVPLWLGLAVVIREVVVSVAVLGLAAMGARRIDVRWVGKAGTFALMVAFPLFLAHRSTLGWHRGAGIVAWAVAIPGLAFSYWAAATYLPVARTALDEGRAARKAREMTYP